MPVLRISTQKTARILLDNSDNVRVFEDKVVFTVDFDRSTRIFVVENLVSRLYSDLFFFSSRSHSLNNSLLRLLLCSLRNVKSASCFSLGGSLLNQHTVC